MPRSPIRSLLAKELGLGIVLIQLAPLIPTTLLMNLVQSFQRDAMTTVVRSEDVGGELQALLTLFVDAEAGQRAYLLTGR